MPVSIRLRTPVEAPGRLELAIREWQRQLVAMAASPEARKAALAPAEPTTGER